MGVVKPYRHPQRRVSGSVPVKDAEVYRPGKDLQQAPSEGVTTPQPTTRDNTQAQGGNRHM